MPSRESTGLSEATVTIAKIERSEVAETVRMIADLSRQEGDPADLFDSATAEADLFSDEGWIRGLFARIDGRPAGVALWHPAYEASYAARGGFVTSLWVEPQFRRRGVATRLIEAVAAEVNRIGGAFLWWASKPGNRGAHATYASLGAKPEAIFAHALTGERFQAMVKRGKEGQAKR